MLFSQDFQRLTIDKTVSQFTIQKKTTWLCKTLIYLTCQANPWRSCEIFTKWITPPSIRNTHQISKQYVFSHSHLSTSLILTYLILVKERNDRCCFRNSRSREGLICRGAHHSGAIDMVPKVMFYYNCCFIILVQFVYVFIINVI